MSIPIPTGTFDIVPEDPKELWRSSYLWNYLEQVIREHVKSYACDEIRTPMFERTELFKRSVGDTTDIVSKEMYTFEDRGGRSLSLRPEGTASVMRAFIEKNMHAHGSYHRLFYIGPMFRYERPQAGRFRQHHQFGVEVIGSKLPQQDAEMIEMLYALYERLGLKNLTVYINSLGDKENRVQYRKALQDYIRPHLNEMSDESKIRFEVNPLRILDSKDERDKKVVAHAPSILDFLSQDAKEHFDEVQRILRYLQIPFEINTQLARGLDYYNRTVFEITSGQLGAQNTIGAGGRYDGLMKELGGPDLPTIGFATGIERILQTILAQHAPHPQAPKTYVYFIPLGQEAQLKVFQLAKILRRAGIVTEVDLTGKKLKGAMQQASDLGVEYVVVIGENELQEGVCELKEMKTFASHKMPISALLHFFTMKKTEKELASMIQVIENEMRVEEGKRAPLLTECIDKLTTSTFHLLETFKKL